MDRYLRLSAFLREHFGCRVQRVAVDAGMSCPNRDGTLGTGGCVYCNSTGSRAAYVDPRLPLREQVKEGIDRLRKRYKAEKFLVYFQPCTNTYARADRLRRLYDQALDHPDVVGMMIGTRPDCIEGDVLDVLEEYHNRTFLSLELGLQSASPTTLRWIRRGHDVATFERASKAARERGLRLTAHMIVGLPTDKASDHYKAADMLNRLGYEGVKIHCLYISSDSPLAALYKKQSFKLMTREQYVERACNILERLDPKIVVHRLTSDADPLTLVEPKWCLDKNGILADIEAELEARDSRQGCRLAKTNL